MKPSRYDPWGPPRSSMVSRMTLSSKSPVRNPINVLQVPHFLTHFQWQNFWRHLNWEELKFSRYLPWGKKNMIHDVRNEPVPNVSGQEPPMSSKYPLLDPPFWHTSNWDINTKFSGYLPWGMGCIFPPIFFIIKPCLKELSFFKSTHQVVS